MWRKTDVVYSAYKHLPEASSWGRLDESLAFTERKPGFISFLTEGSQWARAGDLEGLKMFLMIILPKVHVGRRSMESVEIGS